MNTNSVYKMAAQFVETFHWSVIPLKPGSKVPLIPWTEYQKRFPTPEELQKWFLNTQNGMGIVTGQLSNLSVLDVDSQEALAQLTCTSSITVLTKRGRHSYFLHTGEANSASKIAEHLDVRGEGGFVVAPPSVVDGFRYRFLSPVINHLRLNAFPRELLNVSAPASATNAAKPADWISEALSRLAEGNRNHTFAQIVGRLHRDKHAAATIFSLLSPHAERVGFSLEELDNVIKSTSRYENGQGKGHEIHAQGNQAEDIENFLKGDEKVNWIVSPVLANASIGFIAGLPETNKTWLMMELAIEASIGGKWLGMQTKKTKTLFIDQERFRGETRRRFQKMLNAKKLTAKDLHDNLYIQVGTSVRLNDDASFEAFRRKLEEIRPELVIVDSFATFSTVAENDRQEVQKVLERIKQLRQEFNCSFLMIDHEGKSVLNPESRGEIPDAFKLVGSVAKVAAAETVLTVRKENDHLVIIYHTKSTMAPAMPPLNVTVEDVGEGVVVRTT